MRDALSLLEKKLKEISTKIAPGIEYYAPAAWLDSDKFQSVEPAKFYLEKIAQIRKLSRRCDSHTLTKKEDAVVYNLFPRYASAYDHNRDGVISLDPLPGGFRETGTFLKCIAMLPYIMRMGVNTIYLLPITSIGKDGKKGSLGSPYSIADPYEIDQNLSEPFLGLDVETQFAAFVQAAHKLGMKVILEFVFRTSSRDSHRALERPEWFYWIKESTPIREPGSSDPNAYGTPIFDEDEIEIIKEKVENDDLQDLPSPHGEHIEMFTETPSKVDFEGEKIVGFLDNDERVVIPGAFADWPPDDNQPPWSDVTYLKLYEHPKFNYIAYNTVRMYDKRISKPEYEMRDLWDNIIQIVPHYENRFEIDGVMIDMGHSLPSKLRQSIVHTARANNPDFMFWEENFVISESSLKEGYDAALGYLPFDLNHPEKLDDLLLQYQSGRLAIRMFGTAESHNTHRAASYPGGEKFSKLTWAFVNMLPCLPFILCGFELGESLPINTGLLFEDEEIADLPPEKLPLFSEGQLCWDCEENLIDFISTISEFRKKHLPDNSLAPLCLVRIKAPYGVTAFIRRQPRQKSETLFIGNFTGEDTEEFTINLGKGAIGITPKLGVGPLLSDGSRLVLKLKPYEFFIGIVEPNF